MFMVRIILKKNVYSSNLTFFLLSLFTYKKRKEKNTWYGQNDLFLFLFFFFFKKKIKGENLFQILQNIRDPNTNF